jgi:hypothetical protein
MSYSILIQLGNFLFPYSENITITNGPNVLTKRNGRLTKDGRHYNVPTTILTCGEVNVTNNTIITRDLTVEINTLRFGNFTF